MIVVIGSGPAAISAVQALIQQGHRVTILDTGRQLEAGRREILDRMSTQEPSEWSRDDQQAISGQGRWANEAFNSKLSYGSAYAIDTRDTATGIDWKGSKGFSHSLARGGLSNVWGSSLLPYRQKDIADWPISIKDLRPHYEAVTNFVPSTFGRDDLESILPIYSQKMQHLASSRQGQALLDDLDTNRLALRKAGVIHGQSRLAIWASGDEKHRPCVYCALCLSGCPYGLIYSSAQTLADLIQNERVDYLPNHLVEQLAQTGGGVVISGQNLETKAAFTLHADRVFLATGVLPTAKIILTSLQKLDTPIRLLDSQYFVYPILRAKKIDAVETEKMHTSAQVFLEIDDPAVSAHLVHLQIYGYSDYLRQELDRSFLKWPLRSATFRREFLGRLLVGQGFIHSHDSGYVELTLREAAHGKTSLQARSCPSRQALRTVLKIGWKLTRQSLKMGALPLFPGLLFPHPGSSYHSGGTFPMRHNPGALETDILGRLPAMDRVHLVDASVLPSIPATSITFSVMANAHRIASLAGRLESI